MAVGCIPLPVCAAQSMVLDQLVGNVTLPSVTMTASVTPAFLSTPAEAAEYVRGKSREVQSTRSFRTAPASDDSLRTAVAAAAAQWLARHDSRTVQGLQLDPAGRLSVLANHDSAARALIAIRLATPRLSLADKACTLRLAVEAFSDAAVPTRLPVAEAYLRELDALGDSVASWQYEAHRALLHTYYRLGRSADVVRHGIRAISLVGIMPFADRGIHFSGVGGDEGAGLGHEVYTATVQALAGQPEGRRRIEELNATMRAAAVAPPVLVAMDSLYVWTGLQYQRWVESLIHGNAKLGTVGVPLVAHVWLNRSSSDSATLAVNDGTIRVIEVGSTGCASCIQALHVLQRLHEQFPRVEAVMLTWTSGAWGNRLVEPREEVAHLSDYFLTDRKVTIPVGIWAGTKVPNEDGGLTPEHNPNFAAYPLFSKPVIWVLDGHGIVRRIFPGCPPAMETQLAETVAFLQREAGSSPVSSSASASRARATM